MPYTSGVWKVKAGHAEEFVAAWTEFAEWTKAHAPGAGWAKLLRDASDENRFVTFGPWDSVEAIAAWRALDGWKDRITKLRDLLVSFEALTLALVAEIE